MKRLGTRLQKSGLQITVTLIKQEIHRQPPSLARLITGEVVSNKMVALII